MKLTNKQLEIVVNKIYEMVSLPIIEKNNEALSGLSEIHLPDTEFLNDSEIYEALEKQIDEIEKTMFILKETYKHKNVDGYKFGYHPFNEKESYIKKLKESIVDLKKYPTKEDIEVEVVLSENKGLSDLINELISKFSK